MRSGLATAYGAVLCLCAVSVNGVSQTKSGTSLPTKTNILYTGELDGLLGSWAACPNKTGCPELIDRKAAELAQYKADRGAILLGTGDNFGPASEAGLYYPPQVLAQHKTPNPWLNDVVRFMSQAYDAVVPGKEDFAFGPQFLRDAKQTPINPHGVPLLAANLTIQVVPSMDCFSYPAPTSSLPLLPDQAANPIASSEAGAAGGASSGGSGGGGGGGKGKKGGGGGSSSSAAAAGASTAGAAPLGAGGAGAGCGAGGGTPPGALAKGQSKGPHPTLAWPAATAIYPWTSSIAVSLQGAGAAPSVGYMCPDSDPKHRDEVSVPQCVTWTSQGSYQTGNYRYTLLNPAKIPIDKEGHIAAAPPPDPRSDSGAMLYGGNPVKFCIEDLTKPGTYLCTTAALAAQRTLFEQAWIATGGYVVLGALAPDTLNGLSAVDKEWDANGNDPQMQVSVGDPEAALTQALDTYDRLHPGESSMGVVLAQMTPAEAKSLADSLSASRTRRDSASTQVNLILSGADAYEATPDSSVTLPSGVQHGRFIPVVTPAPIFQRKNCFGSDRSSAGTTDPDQPSTVDECLAEVQFLTVAQPVPQAPGTTATQMKNTPAVAAFAPKSSAASAANTTFCVGAVADSWECLVLNKMRVALSDTLPEWTADVAILEEKDFDYLRGGFQPGPNGTQEPFPSPEQALRALWNAGNLTRVTLLGSTLTSILQQNTSNQAENFQSLAATRQSDQLRVLGIFEQNGTYYIKGVPLDASKLYAVATSDNLANSSSDYTSLASEDQNLPEVFWDHGRTIIIADLANQATVKTAAPVTQADLEPAFPGRPTANDIEQAEAKIAPFSTNLTHSSRTIFLERSSAGDLGELAQTEPFWHVTIQQMSFGYTYSKPSQVDASIGTNFGGVSNPNVVTPHSETISLVYDARTEYYLKRGSCGFCLSDLGSDAQINFTRSEQGSTTPIAGLSPVTTSGATVPTSSLSYPSNTYVLSPFLETQTHVASFWKPVVFRPGLFTTQVVQVEQFLPSATSSTATTPAIDFELDQKRSFTGGGDVGTRLERSDFNYFEFGYSFQRSFDVLSAVAVPGHVCSLTNTMTLAKCASMLPGIAGVPLNGYYSDYSQDGGYMLWTMTQPFFPKPVRKTVFLYQLTAYGNYFAYGRASSSSALTHYAFALNNTFQIALPANFTFGPSYNLFYFQANEKQIGASLHRQSFSGQVSYSFDWHTGLSVKNAFLGKVQ